MILIGSPTYNDLLCCLFILLGFALWFCVMQRRFNRKTDQGTQQFKSYFHALLILFAERLLLLLSFVLILGSMLWYLCS